MNRLVLIGLGCAAASLASAQSLVNRNSTPETQQLFRLLKSVYGKKIISGQCDDKYLPFILSTTGGKAPALMGYDFNGICPSQKGNQDVPKAIAWNAKGGIVQFQWHWISPNADGDFYTKNFDLAKALADPTSSSYKNIIRDLDLVAGELKKLQDAKVPVIWRPLHEAEGKWFWWGMSGGDACKKLYKLIYDRFVKTHGLNNLIWTWTSYAGDKENWYPGDDMVDMIVCDYENKNTWSNFKKFFGDSGKMLGLGEEGKLPDPAEFAKRPWLYFMTWAYMIEDPKKGNTKEWIKAVYSDPRVLTLDDVAKLRGVKK